MNNIIIDNLTCTHCNLCVQVCGSKVLGFENNELKQLKPELCCSCGHCAAICQANAIESAPENPLHFTTAPLTDNLNAIEKLLRTKRSVREFLKTPVDKNIIEQLIRYGEKAPSSGNTRKRCYTVITNQEKIHEMEKAVIDKFVSLKRIFNPVVLQLIKLINPKAGRKYINLSHHLTKLQKEFEAGNSPVFRNAPCVICISAPKKNVQSKDDCVIAEQYIMLYAHSIAIESVIVGYAQYAHKAVARVLNIPAKENLFAVFALGYPKYHYKKEIDYTNLPVFNLID